MSAGRTADARLDRLLYLLPAAMRDEGVPLEEVAEELETSSDRLLEDIGEMTDRSFYQPGGWPDDVQILLDADRIRVVRASGFERPMRLSPTETLCLALGLRGSAASARVPEASARGALLERAERSLAARRVDDGEGAAGDRSVPLPADGVAAARSDAGRLSTEGTPDPQGIRELLVGAARDRRACAIHYVSSGASADTVRVVHPYVVAHAEGAWYTIAWCARSEEERVFRVDRILAADVTDEVVDRPPDFRPEDYFENGRLYRARGDREVVIRYAPSVAGWLREQARWDGTLLESSADGGVTARHRFADPFWVVGHALQYGADAEVLEPADLRALVAEISGQLAAE